MTVCGVSHRHTILKSVVIVWHKCAQVVTDGKFTMVYPIALKVKDGNTLWEYINDVGIPDRLVADLSAEHTGTNTKF